MPETSSTANRREFIAAGLGAALASCAPVAETPQRPNILFAYSDDQSYPHAGILGDPVVKTPAFDRVAREGVLFTHSFTACPSCTPSRMSVIKGRHMWQTGLGGVLASIWLSMFARPLYYRQFFLYGTLLFFLTSFLRSVDKCSATGPKLYSSLTSPLGRPR